MVFVRRLMFLKYSCEKPVKKNCGRPVFFDELSVADCKKFFKGFPVFKQSSQFFKTSFSDIFRNMHFLCATKKVLQKQSTKINLKVTEKSCDETEDDVMKFIL